MLLNTTEVNIELMEVRKECAEWCAFCHLSKGVDILWEALATITKLAVWSRDVGVGVVDIA